MERSLNQFEKKTLATTMIFLICLVLYEWQYATTAVTGIPCETRYITVEESTINKIHKQVVPTNNNDKVKQAVEKYIKERDQLD